jgi:hypothetical protein
VPAVGDLDGLRGADAGRFGIGAGTVAAHNPNTGMLGQPAGDGVRCAVGEHIDRAVGIDVDDDGPVYMP